MKYLIGIDVGTTGAKTILIDERGNLVASSLVEYPLHTPRPKWAEQDPADWWRGTVDSIRNVLAQAEVKADDVSGLGLSGQMHGLVLIDKDYNVLRPAILWCDVRTTEQCHYITEKVGKDLLVESICTPALEGFTAPKVIWVRDNEPQIYEKAFKMLLPKDYVRFLLTGEIASEVSDAAGTILFDVRNREWSRQVLDRLEISPDLMPPCYESIDVCGTISRWRRGQRMYRCRQRHSGHRTDFRKHRDFRHHADAHRYARSRPWPASAHLLSLCTA